MSDLDMWFSDIESRETEELIVSGLGVGYQPPPKPKSSFFASAGFDKDKCILTIIKGDGTEIEISGFIDLSILEGKRGIKGKRGKKGKDGKDGRDGREGKDGCKGKKGKQGKQGETGDRGDTGDTGRRGPDGDKGPDGNPGPAGVTGATGRDGKRGPTGAGCMTGAPGMPGLKPVEVVVVQTNEPEQPNVHLWGEPDLPIYIDPTDDVDRDPLEIEFDITPIELDIKAPSIEGADGTLFKGTALSNIVNFSGGIGPFNFEWSGDYEDQDGVVYVLTQRGRALMLTAVANVMPKETKEFKGKIQLKITDEGHPDRTTKTKETDYRFTLENPADEIIYDPNVWEPRAGAIVYGSRVNHTNGRNIKCEEILKGETIVGLQIDSMTADWKTWKDKLYDGNCRKVAVQVLDNFKGQAKAYYSINSTLNILPNKYVMCVDGEYWKWKLTENLRKGDVLYRKDGQTEVITSIEFIEEQVFTCALEVTEPHNCYYVEGYLVHD